MAQSDDEESEVTDPEELIRAREWAVADLGRTLKGLAGLRIRIDDAQRELAVISDLLKGEIVGAKARLDFLRTYPVSTQVVDPATSPVDPDDRAAGAGELGA